MDTAGAALHDLLARRGQFLTVLAEDDHTKPELVEELGVSRSTVDRAVRELEAQALIERNGNTVRLTTRGGLLVDLHRRFVDITSNIDRLTDTLASIPADHRPDVELFADATVVTAETTAPHRPVSVLEDELATIDRVCTVSMTVIPTLVERVSDRVLNDGLAVDMVVSDAVLERLVSTHSETLAATLDRDQVTLAQTTTDLPYDLAILEEAETRSALLLVHGDGGITALVKSDTPAAVAWAETVFTRERERADPV